MREDFKLPSVSTLSNITSSCNKQTISIFLQNVIGRLEDPKKVCVLLHDEVYIKKSMQYHGGEIFGRAANDPSLLAETMLDQMLICLHPPEDQNFSLICCLLRNLMPIFYVRS